MRSPQLQTTARAVGGYLKSGYNRIFKRSSADEEAVRRRVEEDKVGGMRLCEPPEKFDQWVTNKAPVEVKPDPAEACQGTHFHLLNGATPEMQQQCMNEPASTLLCVMAASMEHNRKWVSTGPTVRTESGDLSWGDVKKSLGPPCMKLIEALEKINTPLDMDISTLSTDDEAQALEKALAKEDPEAAAKLEATLSALSEEDDDAKIEAMQNALDAVSPELRSRIEEEWKFEKFVQQEIENYHEHVEENPQFYEQTGRKPFSDESLRSHARGTFRTYQAQDRGEEGDEDEERVARFNVDPESEAPDDFVEKVLDDIREQAVAEAEEQETEDEYEKWSQLQ